MASALKATDYLSDPALYAKFQFQLKKAVFQRNFSHDERTLADRVIALSADDPDFEGEIALLRGIAPTRLVSEVMHLEEAGDLKARSVSWEDRGGILPLPIPSHTGSAPWDTSAAGSSDIVSYSAASLRSSISTESDPPAFYGSDLVSFFDSPYKLVESAVCYRYLFPGALEENFPDPEERVILEKMIDLHVWIRFYPTPLDPLGAAKEVFDLTAEAPVLERVIHKLTAEIDLKSGSANPPPDFSAHTLPSAFSAFPFNDEAALVSVIENGSVYLFEMPDYSSGKSPLGRLMRRILHAAVLQNVLGVDFQKALKMVFFPDSPAPWQIGRLLNRIHPAGGWPRSGTFSAGEGGWEARKLELLSLPVFSKENLFHQAFLFLKSDGRYANFQLMPLFRAIYERRRTDSAMRFEDIVQECVTRSLLRRMFSSDDDLKNFQECKEVLARIHLESVPTPSVSSAPPPTPRDAIPNIT